MSIKEWVITDESLWFKHKFIRRLEEFEEISENENKSKEKNIFELIGEYLSNPDNSIPLTILTLIIVSTILALRIIRKNNIKRALEEYKEISKEEKLQELKSKGKNKRKNLKT
ncbi:MAG: hypothetical protein ACTSQP_13125 [Promethearchaeota archaeon]